MLEVGHFRFAHATTLISAAARKLLKSLSIKQGIKFDSAESARDILPFIEFHQLNIEENLDPMDSFSTLTFSPTIFCPLDHGNTTETFNQFFYRWVGLVISE